MLPGPLPSGHTIGPMRDDEYDSCMDLVVEAFVHHNAIVRHLGLSRQAYRAIVAFDAPRDVAVDTSLVARDADGRVAAVAFLKVLDLEHTRVPDKLLDAHHNLRTFYMTVARLYTPTTGLRAFGGVALHSLARRQAFHIAVVGTDTSQPVKGLAKALCEGAVALAREHGCSTVLMEAGHPATIKIGRSLGFRDVSVAEAETFRGADGEPSLAGVQDATVVLQARARAPP